MSELKIYKAVIFDLDGTLVNSLDDLADSMNNVLAQNGFPQHPVESYRYFVGDGIAKLVERSLPQKLNGNKNLVDNCIAEMKQFYADNWSKKSRIYPGIKETLSKLSRLGVSLAILSNKPHEFTLKFAEFFLRDWSFSAVEGAKPGCPVKPDPAQALIIAQKMQHQPHEIIYVGDTNTDMQTGKNAGMFTLGATWGFRSREELEKSGAMHIVDNPEEIPALFR